MTNRVLEAQRRAELAEALQRWDSLEYRWQRAKHTSSGGTDTTQDLDVELAQVDAVIVALEHEPAEALAPAHAAPTAIPLPSPAANDVAPAPEYLTTREAAELLRMSTDTLERLRTRPDGPPWKRVGRRVLYPIAGLRDYGTRK